MTIKLEDFLTKEEIKLAKTLQVASKIKEHITGPRIKRINETIGQENDPLYLAYLIEFLISEKGESK